MTKEISIEEGNKIIAEFMGLRYSNTFEGLLPNHWVDENGKAVTSYLDTSLKYHSSWDWLMPVWRKVATMGLWMMTNGYDKLWLEKSKEIEYALLYEETPQKAASLITYLIQWYNKNTQQ